MGSPFCSQCIALILDTSEFEVNLFGDKVKYIDRTVLLTFFLCLYGDGVIVKCGVRGSGSFPVRLIGNSYSISELHPGYDLC